MLTQYNVTTRHGNYDTVSSLEEAQRIAQYHMDGYINGTGAGNDPKPVIRKVTYEVLNAYEYNKDTNTYVDKWND